MEEKIWSDKKIPSTPAIDETFKEQATPRPNSLGEQVDQNADEIAGMGGTDRRKEQK